MVGESQALATHLIENWGLLTAMSRRIAGRVMDPDDLFSEALLKTFSRWETSDEPIEHLNAYLIATMRNRVKDELKSPRSRVESLDDEDALEALPQPELGHIDLFSELSLLREALAQLPPDQRSVLEAMFYRGEKPGELTQRLGRSSLAVSQLARRAKTNLKRTMLRVLLERGSPPRECRHALRELPQRVGDAPPEALDADDHYARCERCRSIWAQFGTFAAAASVGALLVIGDIAGGPAPGAAATTLLAGSSGTGAVGTGAPATGSAVPPPSRRWRVFAASGIAVTAAAIGAYAFWALPQQFSSESSSFDVSTRAIGSNEVEYHIAFDSAAAGWKMRALEIAAPVSAQRVVAPVDWSCLLADGVVHCETASSAAIDADFAVTYAKTPGAEYTVSLHAETAAGARIIGTATNSGEAGNGAE